MSKYNKEELEKLILEDCLSYEEIGRRYNCTGSNIKKVAKRLGIELPQRRKINETETFNKGTGKKIYCINCNKDISHTTALKYCSAQCQSDYEAKKKYEYFLTEPKEFQVATFSYKVIKRFIMEEQHNKCSICGIDNIWNNKELVFVLDHIDGNAANNIRSNYRCVCPNCNAQLDTFCRKNKTSARTYRYKKE